jgi:vacuolar-type H+-ATPase subunit I/STV1
MKTLQNIINAITGSETAKSFIRHALTLLGGYLVGKGLVNEAVSAWLAGGALVFAGALWGAVNEWVNADWRHAILSLLRHGLTSAGTLFYAAGWLPESVDIAELGAALASLLGIFWGVTDEAVAEAASSNSGAPNAGAGE